MNNLQNNKKSGAAPMGYDTLLAPVYQSFHTTCKCGENAELKWTGQWYGNKCQCGTNIRMNRDKSKMIVEHSLNGC